METANFDLKYPVTIKHEDETFELEGVKLNRHQVLSLSVALVCYYKDIPYLDRGGNELNVQEFLSLL